MPKWCSRVTGADEAHPAFSNLFVQTEFVQESSAILCCPPRPFRSREAAVVAAPDGESAREMWGIFPAKPTVPDLSVGAETWRDPAAMRSRIPLSNTVGSVLDPIVSLRRTITIPPHGTAVVNLVLGVAENRDAALAHVEKYQSLHMAERAFDLAWTHNQVTLHHLNVTETEAQLYGRLAGALIYADPARRANPGVLLANKRGKNGLWSYGISGDIPMILLRISDMEKIELVRQLIRAHSYWRMKGLTVDLVILHEDVSIYRQSLGRPDHGFDFIGNRSADAGKTRRDLRPEPRSDSRRRPHPAPGIRTGRAGRRKGNIGGTTRTPRRV